VEHQEAVGVDVNVAEVGAVERKLKAERDVEVALVVGGEGAARDE
jgi:hypothetical protein